ncbi:MAG: MarR family transcriptional regulator [Clostridia bacterium]|nr:MarR family transcriptional regulator [Clostridia bacterium]
MNADYDKERAHQTFYKMIQVDRFHRGIFEKMHSAFGIHRSQHRLLMYISRKDVCPSQKDIAEHFGISAAAVAVSLKKLEDSGYIERESLENDNRFNRISLTEKGKKVVAKSEDFFAESDFAMFRDFSEKDYENLLICLDKMMSGLKSFSENSDNFTSIE